MYVITQLTSNRTHITVMVSKKSAVNCTKCF